MRDGKYDNVPDALQKFQTCNTPCDSDLSAGRYDCRSYDKLLASETLNMKILYLDSIYVGHFHDQKTWSKSLQFIFHSIV